MSTFSTAMIGQTEKALSAILARELAGTEVSEPQWVTLTLAVMAGRSTPLGPFVARADEVLKTGDASACVDALARAGLLTVGEGAVCVSAAGHAWHGTVRARVTKITQRLWGDLPEEDLEVAARVLGVVLERANVELRA